jgi:hypothetical protein
MSSDFDMAAFIGEAFEAELADDLRWERGLAIKCVVSVLLVVLLVVVRQLYFA